MDVIFIIIIVAIGLIVVSMFVYLRWLGSPEHIGQEGENRVHDILMKLPDEYYVFKDVILKTQKGTTQIDHIVVSKYAVFAIETKNYRGQIYGDDNRNNWTQIIVTDVTYRNGRTYTYVKKSRFYNPVKQSLSHAHTIKGYLKDWTYLKVIPIVVFTGEATIEGVETNNLVIYDYQLLDTIQQYKTIYLSDSDLQNVVNRINTKDYRVIVEDVDHIHNIKKAERDTNNKIAEGVCPKCGGKLVMRNGKYGKFWGCTNYPRCTFTLK